MYKLKVYIQNRQKVAVDEEIRAVIRSCCAQVLTDEQFRLNAEVNVTFVDDDEIHRLNLENRDIDRPTDVLSFPLGEGGEYDTDPETGLVMLGDVVISMETAQRQAREYGHSLVREIAFLTVHSMLHLLGYDHMEPDEERDMFARQDKALTKLGITRETEREKMLAGKLYDPTDKELSEQRTAAHSLCFKINHTDPAFSTRIKKLMKKLIPNIGEDTTIEAPIMVDYGENITIGDRCFINFNLTALDCAAVNIGNDVFIGPNVTIVPPVHPMDAQERKLRRKPDGSLYDLEYALPVTIGDRAWIASDVTICGGVEIGEDVVIGAGSVVTKDIPAGSFAAGNPCRVIKKIQ